MQVDPDSAARIAQYPQIIAFRNIPIHGDDLVDHALVWSTVQTQPGYSSQLRDTDQIPFDLLTRPGLQAPALRQIDWPAQQLAEVVFEIEVTPGNRQDLTRTECGKSGRRAALSR